MAVLALVTGLSVTCLPPPLPPLPVTYLCLDTDTGYTLRALLMLETQHFPDLIFCTGDWLQSWPLVGKFSFQTVLCVSIVCSRCFLQSVSDITCHSLELFAVAICDVWFMFFQHQRITEGWMIIFVHCVLPNN